MAGLYDEEFVETLRRGASSLVGEWSLSERTTVRLLTVSENATFLADDPERADPVVLRVHRPGYHSRAEIESELAWLSALRADGVVSVPEPLACRSGGHVAGFPLDGRTRDVVAFGFVRGTEPAEDDALVEGFHRLGVISARLHDHARRWIRPPGFMRKSWTFGTALGPRPHWGDWRNGFGLTADGRALVQRAVTRVGQRLAAYGDGPDRFGLIHADLRLANLLLDGPRMTVIDFDDCGFGWFMYDFAAAVSFFEHSPSVPALGDAWATGYRTCAPLDPEQEAMLPTFVMLRRVLLTAWIASHPETPTARELGAAYTDGTVALAERFLTDAS